MRPAFIIKLILYELKRRNSDSVERCMVRTADASHGKSCYPEIAERFDPLRKTGFTAAFFSK